jgi:hypothetical protein
MVCLLNDKITLMKEMLKPHIKIFGVVALYFCALIALRAVICSGLVWDENWYQGIVLHGYSFSVGSQSSVAFFPVFPILIKLLSFNGAIEPRIIASVINYCAVVGICTLSLKLAAKLNKKVLNRSQKILILGVMLAFPSAFIFVSMYADALLAFFVTAAIYFAFNNRYLLAFAMAGLASGTKSTGITAAVVCLVIVIADQGIGKKNILKIVGYGLLGMSGLLSYMLFLWAKFGDAFLFFTAQSEWERNSGFFINTLWQQLIETCKNIFNTAVSRSFVFARLLSISFVFVSALFVYMNYRKKQWWLVALLLTSIGIPLARGNFNSIIRYALVPLPLLAAFYLPKVKLKGRNKGIAIAIVAISGVVQLALYAYFIRGDVFIA